VSRIPSSPRPQAYLGAGLVLLALLTGCGASTDDGLPEIGTLPTVRSQADIVLPIDHYQGTKREGVMVETAFEELIAECMAERGFAGYPVRDLTAHTLMPRHDNQFGLVSESEAAEFGFTPPWAAALEAESAADSERFAGWSGGDIDIALNGSAPKPAGPGDATTDGDGEQAGLEPDLQSDGCRSAGHRELYDLAGTDPLDRWWADQHQGRTVAAAFEDPRMLPVKEAWSACMKERGYDYLDRSDAGGDERWLVDPEAEKAAAVASVQCTHESRYVDTWVALATAYQEQVIEENAERFAAERAGRDALLTAIRSRGLGTIGGRDGGPPPR
jgi:hypothetical protein